MKASAVANALRSLVAARQPAFIWGPPGIGKSSIVAQLAKSLNLSLRDIRALLLDPVDLRWLPYVAEGRSKWAIPEFLPADGAGILFLDELNAAPAMLQAAFYQLVLDRRLGVHAPDGWIIIAAGNRDADRAHTTRMPTEFRILSVRDATLRDQKIKYTAGDTPNGQSRTITPLLSRLEALNSCSQRLPPGSSTPNKRAVHRPKTEACTFCGLRLN
jgi:ATPase family associated with various cellular activities (AAA)